MGGCIVAVVMPDGRGFSKTMQTDREQAAKLMPMVQEVVAEAGIGFGDLGLIITTVGPGSFTGLRISLSAARAMGLALGIPVQGVSTFEAVRESCFADLPLSLDPSPPRGRGKGGEADRERGTIVVLESKRADFYVQEAGKDGVCLTATEIAAMSGRICGDGISRLGSELGEDTMQKLFACSIECNLPNPIILARIGLEKFLENGGRAEKPEPVYLRGADVSVSNKIQREISNFQQ